MSRLLEKYGLALNTEKCKAGAVGKESYEYLGYIFHADAVIPRRQSISNLERWLEKHMRSWKSAKNKTYWEWRLKLRISGCRITGDGKAFNRYGWLFYFSQSTDAITPHKLDALVHKLAKRYDAALPNDLPSFSKCYYSIHFRNGVGSCIPIIDLSIPIKEKAAKLRELYGNEAIIGLTDEEIDHLFRRRMLQEAKTLERDVGVIS